MMGPIGLMGMMAAAGGELPDPKLFSSIGWVCVILVSIMFGINQAIKLKNGLAGPPPQPPNQVLGVSTQELQRRVAQVEQRVEESDRRRKALYDRIESSAVVTRESMEHLRVEIKRDIEGVHERVNAIAIEQGGQKTSIELLNQRLAQIGAQLEQRFGLLDQKLMEAVKAAFGERRMPS